MRNYCLNDIIGADNLNEKQSRKYREDIRVVGRKV
jgi:hypothetical protein